MTADLIEVFARPLRERLAELGGDAKAIAAVRTELEVAALSFGAYTEQQAKQAAALSGRTRAADALTADLRRSATALAAATALADRAAAAVHTGLELIRDLVDEYLLWSGKTLAAAAKLAENGRYDALIGAAGRLAARAEEQLRRAEDAQHTVRRVLSGAARQLTELTAFLPAGPA